MEKNLRRRIQKIKGGSYIITLPPEWVRRNNLDAKSEVFVIEKNGELLIKPIRDYITRKIIDLDLIDLETTKYLITVYYMQGISEIEIKSKSVISAPIKDELKNLQLYLPGLTIESESFNYITFKVQDDVNTNVVERMKTFSSKLLVLLKDLEKIIENPSKEMAIDLKNRAEELNKLYNSVIREIALVSQEEEEFVVKGLPTRDLILYAIAMRDMGRMLSHIKTASLAITECGNTSNDKELNSIIKIIVNMFEKSREVFFDENIDHVRSIRESMKEINKIVYGSKIECRELARELARIASYCVALMDDGVHKSVKI
ncbi:AbrB/MazE/SpoVT family DNA-binding domain-containing protein [Saccharolobus solfataricus]